MIVDLDAELTKIDLIFLNDGPDDVENIGLSKGGISIHMAVE